MRAATLCRFLALASLSGLASCGSSDSSLLVTVSNLPPRAVQLSLQATLDGKPAMSVQTVPVPITQVGVELPGVTSGHVVLTISALDADGCSQASVQVPADLPGQAIQLSAALVAQSPRACGSLAPCMAGTICPYAPKPIVSFNLWGLWANSPTDIWAVGEGATALHYDGMSWKNTTIPLPVYLNGVWASGPKDVWTVGEAGSIFHFDGQSWTQMMTSASASDLTAVYGTSPTNVWSVGGTALFNMQPEVWHWTGGPAWSKVVTGNNGSLLGVWGSGPNDINASGFGGQIQHFDGNAWTVANTGTSNDLHTIWGTAANQIYAAGYMGTVLHYDGTAWTKLPVNGYGAIVYGIVGDGTSIYGVGNDGVNGDLIKATAPFASFAVQGTGITNDLTAIVVGSNGIGWVTGKSGFLGYFDTRP